MEQHLVEIRDRAIYLLWEKNKNSTTMEELAKIFNISTKSIYRILKVESKKESENKSDFSI